MDLSERLSTALTHFDYSSTGTTEYLQDHWLATSALQKAIRRGDTEVRYGPSLFSPPLNLNGFGGGLLSSPWRISGSLTWT